MVDVSPVTVPTVQVTPIGEDPDPSFVSKDLLLAVLEAALDAFNAEVD